MDPTSTGIHHHPPTLTADINQRFLCNGCRTDGIGKRYRCNACNYDLHGFCATGPGSLSSFMHPHPLTLDRNPASSAHPICDICRETVNGLFYRCADCNFDVHPICTQLPERINHILDKSHLLTCLQTAQVTPAPSAVTHAPGGAMRAVLAGLTFTRSVCWVPWPGTNNMSLVVLVNGKSPCPVRR